MLEEDTTRPPKPSLSMSLPTRAVKGAWVRDRPSTKTKPTATLPQQVDSLVAENQRYRAELKRRATQTSDLCAMASTVRTLVIKIHSGKFEKSDFTSVEPPKIFLTASEGCVDGTTFIKDTLALVKPSLISLYKEQLDNNRTLLGIESACKETLEVDSETDEVPLHPGLTQENLIEFAATALEDLK